MDKPAPAKKLAKPEPWWMSPTLWSLTVALIAIFTCVMSWQMRGAKGIQGAGHPIGLASMIACIGMASVLSIVVLWKPQPAWTAYVPLGVGGLILLLGAVYAVVAIDRSSGDFVTTSIARTGGISARLAYGYYLHLLCGAAMIGIGIAAVLKEKQLLKGKQAGAAPTAAAVKKPAAPTSTTRRR